MRRLVLCAGAALLLWAKDPLDLPRDNPAALRGPVLGFVFDAASAALRPVQGMPGAAVMAAPLDMGVALATAVVSPSQNSALGLAAGDGRVLVLNPQEATARPLDGVRPAPDQIVFSPRGSAAALFYGDTTRAQVIGGLPDNPAPGMTLDLSALSGTLTALAVADDGGALLAAVSDADTASVYAATADAGPRLVYTLHHVPALAFVDGRRDALIADDADNQVWLARDVTGDNAVTLLAGPDDGIAGPAAVRTSADGARALVANAQSGSITAIGLDDRQVSTVSCGCTPTALERLDGGALLRLTEPADDTPLWLLDTTAAAAYFVPAGSKAVQQ